MCKTKARFLLENLIDGATVSPWAWRPMSSIGWVVRSQKSLEQGADSHQQECGAVPNVALTTLTRWNEVSLGSPFDW